MLHYGGAGLSSTMLGLGLQRLVILASCGSSTYGRGFGRFTLLTTFHPFHDSHVNSAFWFWVVVLGLWLFGCWVVWLVFCLFFPSESWRFASSNYDALDDRQGFYTRSAMRQKKTMPPPDSKRIIELRLPVHPMDWSKSCAPRKHLERNLPMPLQLTNASPIGLAQRVMCKHSAHWATSVCAVVKPRTAQFDARRDHGLQVSRAWHQLPEQQPQRDGAGVGNATVLDGVAFFLRSVDLRPGTKEIPSLVVSVRAPWLELPVADFVNSMSTIYQGVLNGIFRQMPIAAWFTPPCKRIQMTIVRPSDAPLEDWQSALALSPSTGNHSAATSQQVDLYSTSKKRTIQTYPWWA